MGSLNLILLFLIFESFAAAGFGAGCYQSAEGEQCDDVRDDHELVEHVRQLPYEVIGKQRAEEDERDSDDRVRQNCLFAEQILNVYATEEVPADYGRECEEQQADRNEGDQIVYQTEKTLEEMGDKVDPGIKSEIEAKLQALKTALTGTDTAAIKNATKELTDVFGKMYEAAQAAQSAQGGAGFDPNAQAGGDSNGQDYYDADYTVVDDDDKK